MSGNEELIKRLEKTHIRLMKYAEDNAKVCTYLQPEVDAFEDNEKCNLSVVKLAVEYKNQVKEDFALATDLKLAIDILKGIA